MPQQPSKNRAAASAGPDSSERAPADGASRLTPLRELQLAELARGGDAAALAELLWAYQRRIYTICYRMLRSDEDARDLTQDVVIKMIEGLHTYDGRAKLSTWVIRVTMNCCLSHLRKEKVRRHHSLDEATGGAAGGSIPASVSHGAEAAADGGGHSGSPDSGPGQRELSVVGRIEHNEAQAAVVKALSRLEADIRAILVLRDVQDLEYETIAQVLEIPLGTVKSRLFRAREALRREVESELGHAERPEIRRA